jgi:hypothetical protein
VSDLLPIQEAALTAGLRRGWRTPASTSCVEAPEVATSDRKPMLVMMRLVSATP